MAHGRVGTWSGQTSTASGMRKRGERGQGQCGLLVNQDLEPGTWGPTQTGGRERVPILLRSPGAVGTQLIITEGVNHVILLGSEKSVMHRISLEVLEFLTLM